MQRLFHAALSAIGLQHDLPPTSSETLRCLSVKNKQKENIHYLLNIIKSGQAKITAKWFDFAEENEQKHQQRPA